MLIKQIYFVFLTFLGGFVLSTQSNGQIYGTRECTKTPPEAPPRCKSPGVIEIKTEKVEYSDELPICKEEEKNSEVANDSVKKSLRAKIEKEKELESLRDILVMGHMDLNEKEKDVQKFEARLAKFCTGNSRLDSHPDGNSWHAMLPGYQSQNEYADYVLTHKERVRKEYVDKFCNGEEFPGGYNGWGSDGSTGYDTISCFPSGDRPNPRPWTKEDNDAWISVHAWTDPGMSPPFKIGEMAYEIVKVKRIFARACLKGNGEIKTPSFAKIAWEVGKASHPCAKLAMEAVELSFDPDADSALQFGNRIVTTSPKLLSSPSFKFDGTIDGHDKKCWKVIRDNEVEVLKWAVKGIVADGAMPKLAFKLNPKKLWCWRADNSITHVAVEYFFLGPKIIDEFACRPEDGNKLITLNQACGVRANRNPLTETTYSSNGIFYKDWKSAKDAFDKTLDVINSLKQAIYQVKGELDAANKLYIDFEKAAQKADKDLIDCTEKWDERIANEKGYLPIEVREIAKPEFETNNEDNGFCSAPE